MSTNQFVAAKIVQFRTLAETAFADEVLESGITLSFSDEGTTEVRWEVSEENQVLSIVPELNAKFKEAGTGALKISYVSRHEIRFEVLGYTGFDPEKDLPDAAIAPYIEMALWMVRGKASNSIRGLGIAAFSWPKSVATPVDPPGSTTVEPTPKPKPRARSKPAKSVESQ